MERQLTIKDHLNQVKSRFVELVDQKTFEKEVSFALQHINKNPQLKKATIASKQEAVLNVAQTGLTLNPVLKFAYLVPRSQKVGNSWETICCLEPSYQGLCKAVTDTGSAKSISAQLVYDGDEFEVTLGTSTSITHKPKFHTKDITHAYMVAVLSDGSKMIEVMTIDQLNDIRERSESWKAFKANKIKSCVWESDRGEMCRKTVIRRGIKYLPKTEMWDKLGEIIKLDETDYSATDGQINYIESLLQSAAVDHDERASIESEFTTMSQERARELIDYLQENQLDPVDNGQIKAMGQITDKINQIKD